MIPSLQAESIYVIKAYIGDMTKSELFCVLVNGMSSLGGTSMVVFMGFGVSTCIQYLGFVLLKNTLFITKGLQNNVTGGGLVVL